MFTVDTAHESRFGLETDLNDTVSTPSGGTIWTDLTW